MGLSESEFKSLCQAAGVQFFNTHDASFCVERSSAEVFIGCCRDQSWIILGIEGFKITEDATRILDYLVADFSSIDSSPESCDEALLFLKFDKALEASHFDFTIADGSAIRRLVHDRT